MGMGEEVVCNERRIELMDIVRSEYVNVAMISWSKGKKLATTFRNSSGANWEEGFGAPAST